MDSVSSPEDPECLKLDREKYELRLLRDPETNSLGFQISNIAAEEEEEDKVKQRGDIIVKEIIKGGPASVDGKLQKGKLVNIHAQLLLAGLPIAWLIHATGSLKISCHVCLILMQSA